MNVQEAQSKISSAIMADPENVIQKAEIFNPTVKQTIIEVRKVSGPLSGVAATALRYALRGANNAETTANIIRFAELL